MKSHLDTPKEKLYCFINNCERFYFSLETLKKHLQKSHKKEYDLLKEEYSNKNFNQIYNIVKNHNGFKENLDFINFKQNVDFENFQDENNDDLANKNNKNNNLKRKNNFVINEDEEYSNNEDESDEEEIDKVNNKDRNELKINNNNRSIIEKSRQDDIIKKTANLNISHFKIINKIQGNNKYLID